MTYEDLQYRLSLLMVTTVADANFLAILPTIIEAAELRCYRDCDFPAARRVQQISLPQGTSSVGAPTDLVAPRALWLLASGVVVGEIQRRDASYLREYAPDPAAQGAPRYFATTDQGTILLAPAAGSVSGGYSARMEYTYRPAPLSVSNPTTWLSVRYPDLLVYAAMVVASGYQRNFGAQSDDPQMPGSWERLYQQALATARNEAALGKGWGAFDRTPAPPPAAIAPG